MVTDFFINVSLSEIHLIKLQTEFCMLTDFFVDSFFTFFRTRRFLTEFTSKSIFVPPGVAMFVLDFAVFPPARLFIFTQLKRWAVFTGQWIVACMHQSKIREFEILRIDT